MKPHKTAVCLLVQGRVQGIGLRPVIARLAADLNLNGFVQNSNDGVLVHVEGDALDVSTFTTQLPDRMPAHFQGEIESAESVFVADYAEFRIMDGIAIGALAANVPIDRAMCLECARELTERNDRRFGYPFSSCTQCGPRYSIIDAMPFERHDTTMNMFELCKTCQSEFEDSDDRRCHAQIIACPACGPQVSFESAVPSIAGAQEINAQDAIVQAAAVIRAGGVIAVKGIGGYQLICDATNAQVVQRLRQRKQRWVKPFAVMVQLTEKFSRALLSAELEILKSSENPILIVDEICHPGLAPNVNPATHSLGLFTATTPLHAILLDELQRPLVVTSGNVDSEPLVYDNVAATELLSYLADGWLHHDRRIERPLDDSVVRIIAGLPVTIRAARGIAPLPLPLNTSDEIFATGGEQKVACAVSNGKQTILAPYLGEMKSVGARQRFQHQATSLQLLYRTSPNVIAHDLHPDYFTTRWAEAQGVRTIAVQHHHAHVVSAMVQHRLLEEEVLGVAFDGAGYGPDGTIWGGEFLLASRLSYQRVASLQAFALPGGDMAVREPWRTAVSLLKLAVPELAAEEIAEFWSSDGQKAGNSKPGSCVADRNLPEDLVAVPRPAVRQIQLVQTMISSGLSPLTSSLGRLFDGIASLVLGISSVDYEGEAAVRLEAACGSSQAEIQRSTSSEGSAFVAERMHGEGPMRIDWRPVVRWVVTAIKLRRPAVEIARDFHCAVAEMVVAIVSHWPEARIVLTGGCFQNRILTEMVIRRLEEQHRKVFTHGDIPANDGGLAVGQLAVAAAILDREAQYREAQQGTRSCA